MSKSSRSNGEEKEINVLMSKIDRLEEKLLEKRPSHFRKRDIVNAFFGALIVGLTFIFKGLLFEIGLKIGWMHIALIIVSTILILTAQIYYIGYSRVKDRKERPFLQFWAKRIVTIYAITLFVSFFLIYLYGIDSIVGSFADVTRLVFAISLPCAVGAAIPSLLKTY